MKFKQKIGIVGGQLEFCLSDKDTLSVKRKKLFNEHEVKYLLDHIDPKYETYKKFSFTPAIFCFLFFLAAVGLGFHAIPNFGESEAAGSAFLGVTCFVLSCILLYQTLKSRLNLVVYRDGNGNTLFSLHGNRPSKDEVDSFCTKLSRNIEKIRYSGEISPVRMKDILARHVEFLNENSVLDDSETTKALANIENIGRAKLVDINKANS